MYSGNQMRRGREKEKTKMEEMGDLHHEKRRKEKLKRKSESERENERKKNGI